MAVAVPVMIMAVPLLFAGLLVVLLGSAHPQRGSSVTTPAGWSSAAGMVTDEKTWRRGTREGIALIRQPVVVYHLPDGREVRFINPTSGAVMPRPGDAVPVVYDPLEPEQAVIDPAFVPRSGRAIYSVAIAATLMVGIPVFVSFEAVGLLLLINR